MVNICLLYAPQAHAFSVSFGYTSSAWDFINQKTIKEMRETGLWECGPGETLIRERRSVEH